MDPSALADLAKRRLRVKIPALVEALTGRFNDHHAFLARMHLDVIDQRTRQIAELSARIGVVMEPFRSFADTGTNLSAKYRRIAARRGSKKALVAVEHAILTAVWNMAHTGALYDDPGADYYTRIDPARSRRRALNRPGTRI